MSVFISNAPLLTQLFIENLGKAAEALGPRIHVGHSKEVPAFQLWTSPALAMAAMWDVHQRMEDLLLSLPLSESLSSEINTFLKNFNMATLICTILKFAQKTSITFLE